MKLPIQINLPDGFLEEEVRCGYTVTQKLKKIWAIQLDLLTKLEEVCKKYGIRYHVVWGTLLGAVRHKGFIPWDDDFDVCMDRENFDKLCALPQEEFPNPYFLQTALSDRRYFLPYARLRNSETTGVIHGMESSSYNNGIYIDIYVFDGITKSKFLWNVQAFLKHVALVPLQAYYQEGIPCQFLKKIAYIAKPIWRILPYEFWYWLYVLILKMYNRKAERWGVAYSFIKGDWNHWVAKNEFKETKYVPYEFVSVPIFEGADSFLARRYGEYMHFPPVANRGKWHEGIIHYEPEIPYKEYLGIAQSNCR